MAGLFSKTPAAPTLSERLSSANGDVDDALYGLRSAANRVAESNASLAVIRDEASAEATRLLALASEAETNRVQNETFVTNVEALLTRTL